MPAPKASIEGRSATLIASLGYLLRACPPLRIFQGKIQASKDPSCWPSRAPRGPVTVKGFWAMMSLRMASWPGWSSTKPESACHVVSRAISGLRSQESSGVQENEQSPELHRSTTIENNSTFSPWRQLAEQEGGLLKPPSIHLEGETPRKLQTAQRGSILGWSRRTCSPAKS